MLTLQKQETQGISLVELNLRLVQILTKCNANSVTRPIWIEMFPLLILLAYVITPRYYIQISSGRSHKFFFVWLENFGSICKDTDTGVSHVSSHRTARDIKRRSMTWCNAWSNGDDRQRRSDSKTDGYCYLLDCKMLLNCKRRKTWILCVAGFCFIPQTLTMPVKKL